MIVWKATVVGLASGAHAERFRGHGPCFRQPYPFPPSHAPRALLAAVQVVANAGGEAGPGFLQRLGRVIKEKAAGDFDRFFAGTSKTRERLGVSGAVQCPSQARIGRNTCRPTCFAAPVLADPITTNAHKPAPRVLSQQPTCPQLVDEMLALWSLEDYEDSLEELEEVLIVSGAWAWAGGGRGGVTFMTSD